MRRLVALGLVALLAAQSLARAQIPADQGALILLRILAYDRRLAAAPAAPLRIGVLYRIGQPRSEQASTEMVTALAAAAKRVRVAGRAVVVVALPYAASGFEASLEGARLSALLIGPGLDADVERVAAATRKHKVLSLTMEEPLAGSGPSIVVARRGERAAILVDLPAARAEGADLSAGLLRLAEVIRR